MPIGRGAFISPAGEFVEVPEHFEFVRDNHALFGFKPHEIQRFFEVTKKNKAELRQELLTEVIRRDWIRLRLTKQWHFQYWRLDDWTLVRIREALKKWNAWENDIVFMGELSTGKRDEVRAAEILGPQAETWVAGIGDVCCICSRGLVSGMGIGDIGPRPVCANCDAFPLQGVMR